MTALDQAFIKAFTRQDLLPATGLRPVATASGPTPPAKEKMPCAEVLPPHENPPLGEKNPPSQSGDWVAKQPQEDFAPLHNVTGTRLDAGINLLSPLAASTGKKPATAPLSTISPLFDGLWAAFEKDLPQGTKNSSLSKVATAKEMSEDRIALREIGNPSPRLPSAEEIRAASREAKKRDQERLRAEPLHEVMQNSPTLAALEETRERLAAARDSVDLQSLEVSSEMADTQSLVSDFSTLSVDTTPVPVEVTPVPVEVTPAAAVAAVPGLPEFKPAQQVDHFTWPIVCRRLMARADEEFDRLADAILAMNAQGKKVLAFGSRRRGEGTTTLLLCIARRLAERGVKPALVEADS